MLAVMRDDHFAKLARALWAWIVWPMTRAAPRGRAASRIRTFIKPLVQSALMTAGTDEWKRRLDEAGVPCSPVLELAAALSQPQVEHRGLVVEMKDGKTGATMRSFNTAFQYAHGGPGAGLPAAAPGSAE